MLTATKNSFQVNLEEMDSVCTHRAPNRLQLVPEGTEINISDDPNDLEYYHAALSQPNLAEVTRPDGSIIKGTWTIMYDQALILETPECRFYSNFKHTLKPDYHDIESLSDLHEASYEAFNSECHKTMVGMIQYKSQDGIVTDQFGCFSGSKLDRVVSETEEQILDDEDKQIVYRIEAEKKLSLDQVRYEDMQDYVDYVNTNKNKFTWNAEIHERYQGLNLAQVKSHIKHGGEPNSAGRHHALGAPKFQMA